MGHHGLYFPARQLSPFPIFFCQSERPGWIQALTDSGEQKSKYRRFWNHVNQCRQKTLQREHGSHQIKEKKVKHTYP